MKLLACMVVVAQQSEQLAGTLGSVPSYYSFYVILLASKMCFTSSVVLLAMCTLSYTLLVTCRSLLYLVILWQVRKQTRTSARPSRLMRRRQGHSLETFSKWLSYGMYTSTTPACPYHIQCHSSFLWGNLSLHDL